LNQIIELKIIISKSKKCLQNNHMSIAKNFHITDATPHVVDATHL